MIKGGREREALQGSPPSRSASPESSPRCSPRLPPKEQQHREAAASSSDSQRESCDGLPANGHNNNNCSSSNSLLICTKEAIDGQSISSQESALVRSSSQESTTAPFGKEKKEGHRSSGDSKKKKAWYSALYPSYKSRSEEFRRTFKDVPPDERLVVDYSCALHREILAHGRLYVSQNYLCFHANIFGWATVLSIKWKDVTAIIKEKTALVIPNAILVHTNAEKYFFTSFYARDKTFVMLFRIWQNALLDQQFPLQELWQWVHQSYGEELGLTSDDEDYIAPGSAEVSQLPTKDFEDCVPSNINGASGDIMEHAVVTDKNPYDSAAELPTSESSDITDEDKNIIELQASSKIKKSRSPKLLSPRLSTIDLSRKISNESIRSTKCSSLHEGRCLLDETYPVSVDELYNLLFGTSDFLVNFHTERKNRDIVFGEWATSPAGGRSRVITLTVSLAAGMGPKTSQVTEIQTMTACAPGECYAIDVEATNAGIPYADSFFLATHYCLKKKGPAQALLTIYGQIKYKKSVWGLVRGIIEKNCWNGMAEFYESLNVALKAKMTGSPVEETKRRLRRKRLPAKSASRISELTLILILFVLVFLIIINGLLYYKLWSLEESPPSYKVIDLHFIKDKPHSHEEWINLLQRQEASHSIEVQRWQKALRKAIGLLKKSEGLLTDLQSSIHVSTSEGITSVLEELKTRKEQEL